MTNENINHFYYESTAGITVETMTLTAWAQTQPNPQKAYDIICSLGQALADALLEVLDNSCDHLITIVAKPPNENFGPHCETSFFVARTYSSTYKGEKYFHSTSDGTQYNTSLPIIVPSQALSLAYIGVGTIVVRTFTKDIDEFSSAPIKEIGGYIITDQTARAISVEDMYRALELTTDEIHERFFNTDIRYVRLPELAEI